MTALNLLAYFENTSAFYSLSVIIYFTYFHIYYNYAECNLLRQF
jgi:hypothetical protein